MMKSRKRGVTLSAMLVAIFGIIAGMSLAFSGIINLPLSVSVDSEIFYVTTLAFFVPGLFLFAFIVDFRECYILNSDYLKIMQDSIFVIFLLIVTISLILFPSIGFARPPGPPLPEEMRVAGLVLLYCTFYVLYFLARFGFINEFALSEIENRRRGKRSNLKRDDVRKMSRDGNIIMLRQVLENDHNFRNRELAAVGLGCIGATSSIDILKHGLEDEEKTVRLACAIALCKLNDDNGKSVLEYFYQEGNINEKVAVVRAVQQLDCEWAIAIVSTARKDRKSAIREAAE